MLDRSLRRPILEILGIGFRIIGNTIAGGDLRVWHHDLVVKVEIGVNVAARSEAEIGRHEIPPDRIRPASHLDDKSRIGHEQNETERARLDTAIKRAYADDQFAENSLPQEPGFQTGKATDREK